MRFPLRRETCAAIALVLVLFYFVINYHSVAKWQEIGPGIGPGKIYNVEQEIQIQELEDAVSMLRNKLSVAEKAEKELLFQIDQLRKRSDRQLFKGNLPKALNDSDDESGIPAIGKLYGCKHIDGISITRTIGKGQIKIVQEGKIHNRVVAVKSASYEAPGIQGCLKEKLRTKDESQCFLLGNYKILKEALILRQLSHPNIVGLLGFCVRSEENNPLIRQRGVTVVVEAGGPVQLHVLKEKSWLERVQLSIQIAQLLDYLADSPIGSVAVLDFRDDQFVTVGSHIKLADLDDVTAMEPKCDKHMKCSWTGGETSIRCNRDMRCPGLNAYVNLQRAKEVFLSPLLLRGVPDAHKKMVEGVLKHIGTGNLYAEEVVRVLSKMISP